MNQEKSINLHKYSYNKDIRWLSLNCSSIHFTRLIHQTQSFCLIVISIGISTFHDKCKQFPFRLFTNINTYRAKESAFYTMCNVFMYFYVNNISHKYFLFFFCSSSVQIAFVCHTFIWNDHEQMLLIHFVFFLFPFILHTYASNVVYYTRRRYMVAVYIRKLCFSYKNIGFYVAFWEFRKFLFSYSYSMRFAIAFSFSKLLSSQRNYL